MNKKQLLSTLVLSTLALSRAGFVSADEITPVDPTVPSTEIVTPSEPSQPVEPSNSGETPVTQPSEVEQPITPVDPTSPSIEDKPVEDNQDTSTTDSSSSDTGDKEMTTPGLSKPAENQDAQKDTNAQSDSTSQGSHQPIQNVTPEKPVETNTGASVVGTDNGQLILSDGSTVSPESIGGVKNPDKTITVTKVDGTKVTLPETGENTSVLGLLGATLLAGLRLILKKKSDLN